MSDSILVLGRQPALGLAELERRYGSDALLPVGDRLALLNVEPQQIAFDQLGGSMKLAAVVATPPLANFGAAIKTLTKLVPELIANMPEGKIRLGLNFFGLPNVSVSEINRAGLQIKTAIKRTGRSVRVVPNSSSELNSAQTLHNQLTGPTGLELIIAQHGDHLLLAQVIASQNINAYASRDQARPKRDARVGMLPPKLAQIIVNLSGVKAPATLLDPFCGTGVVLQEALLMGLNAYGTDLDPRMIDYASVNLDWLSKKFPHQPPENSFRLAVGDATNQHWQPPFEAIAAETYLGRPFAHQPDEQTLRQVIHDVDTIHRKFLKNVAQQTKSGFGLCLAVPAWFTKNRLQHLPTLDSLEDLGYTRMSFAHVRNQDLIYHRPEQIVGRELVVLTRK